MTGRRTRRTVDAATLTTTGRCNALPVADIHHIPPHEQPGRHEVAMDTTEAEPGAAPAPRRRR